jgi:hypothetical protein
MSSADASRLEVTSSGLGRLASSWSLSRSKGIRSGLSGTSDSSKLVPGGFTDSNGMGDGRMFSIGNMLTGGRTATPPLLKPNGAVSSDDGWTQDGC